jgi:hypothetical protein
MSPNPTRGFIEMTATASLKQKVTLEERVIALMDELDAALDELAEQKRPKGRLSSDTPDGLPAIVGALPAGSMRVEFDLRARKQFPGECLCKSYHAAITASAFLQR